MCVRDSPAEPTDFPRTRFTHEVISSCSSSTPSTFPRIKFWRCESSCLGAFKNWMKLKMYFPFHSRSFSNYGLIQGGVRRILRRITSASSAEETTSQPCTVPIGLSYFPSKKFQPRMWLQGHAAIHFTSSASVIMKQSLIAPCNHYCCCQVHWKGRKTNDGLTSLLISVGIVWVWSWRAQCHR